MLDPEGFDALIEADLDRAGLHVSAERVENGRGERLPVRVDGLRRMSLYTEDHKEKAGRGSKEDSPPISSTL